MGVLEEVHVKDLALIKEVWLEFGPGLTVLTGETGAGKTALLGALKLLVGERADASTVRTGASEALVEGRFSIAGDEVVARRRVGADGRSRCALNGEMATVSALAERVGPAVDLHGQHEHQSLLRSATHVDYLDRWAGEAVAAARAAYEAALTGFREARSAVEALEQSAQSAERDADYLRFVVDEIDRVAPEAGEDDRIAAALPAMQHAERLSQAASEAAQLVRGEGGARDALARAVASLDRLRGIDPRLDELTDQLSGYEVLVDEAGSAVRAYGDSIEHDPAAYDRLLGRQAQLAGLMKKYGPRLADVLERRDAAAASLALVADRSESIAHARAAMEAARARLEDTAQALADARRSNAPGFVKRLEAAVADLAMDGARFEVAFDDLPFDAWGPHGSQRIEIVYSPAAGVEGRPLAKIASGGEMSRVMLALKGVLGSADTVETLVFDEVDAGIGGATATAVGQRLAQLAHTHQVLVVTHLAQVAAFANAHLVVSKSNVDGEVATEVVAVDAEQRVREIARMLSGSDSDAGLEHARELLTDAGARFTVR